MQMVAIVIIMFIVIKILIFEIPRGITLRGQTHSVYISHEHIGHRCGYDAKNEIQYLEIS